MVCMFVSVQEVGRVFCPLALDMPNFIFYEASYMHKGPALKRMHYNYPGGSCCPSLSPHSSSEGKLSI